jgi:hypothetical protein
VFHVRICNVDAQLLENIVAGCPLLRDLSCMECVNVNITKTASMFRPDSPLRRLELSALDSGALELIADMCPALEKLSVHSAANITQEAWAKLFTSCTALQKLRVVDCKHLDLSSLLKLRSLRSLIICDCPAVTDSFILSIAAANVGLAKLFAVGCRWVTYEVVYPLLASCPWVHTLCLTREEEEVPTFGTHQLIEEYVRRQHPHVQSVTLHL